MSGVTDFVSKAFKAVKSTATKLWDNKIIRAAIIAVAVYYTAGLAAEAGWFAPVAGEGGTLAAAGANGTSFTTVSAGVTESAVAEGGLTLAGSAAPAASVGSADALALGGATAGTGGAATGGVVTGAEFVGTAGAEMAAGGAAVAPVVAAAPAAASPGIVGSTMGWMQANPMATMMLGQGVSGAMSSYEMRKAEDRAREQENREFERRGTLGYDTKGNYAGQPGIVASQVAAPTASASAAPAAQKVRPIERKNLTELHNQGLVQSQQRA